eukprot:5944635-Amphidinium_carterae.1
MARRLTVTNPTKQHPAAIGTAAMKGTKHLPNGPLLWAIQRTPARAKYLQGMGKNAAQQWQKQQ